MLRPARLVFSLFAVAFFGSQLSAQACSTFEAASIRPTTAGLRDRHPAELAPGGKRLTATGEFMIELLMSAYDVSPLQISGIPSAFSQERYDINGTCERPMMKEQIPHLLQELLAERFHLAVHRELKEQPVFALVLGKGAPKLHDSCKEGGKAAFTQRDYRFTFTNAGMSVLVGVLSQLSSRKVLDRTGLHGQYDFTLSYSPNPAGAASPAADGLPDSVFTALREQLGLNLEAQKGQVEFIVVDRLDRLTPN